jgi:hypothetical protein
VQAVAQLSYSPSLSLLNSTQHLLNPSAVQKQAAQYHDDNQRHHVRLFTDHVPLFTDALRHLDCLLSTFLHFTHSFHHLISTATVHLLQVHHQCTPHKRLCLQLLHQLVPTAFLPVAKEKNLHTTYCTHDKYNSALTAAARRHTFMLPIRRTDAVLLHTVHKIHTTASQRNYQPRSTVLPHTTLAMHTTTHHSTCMAVFTAHVYTSNAASCHA